ncbi:MAG: ethylbenzene dehydrogenase-related protein [Planctomycetota bacterium]
MRTAGLVLAFLLSSISGCFDFCDSPVSETQSPYGLTADGLPALPVLDLNTPPPFIASVGSDWRDTKSLDVVLRNKAGEPFCFVEVRAVRSGDEIIIAIRFADNTESLNRLWVYRNSVWQSGLVLDPRTKEWNGGPALDDGAAIIIPDIDARPALVERGATVIAVEKPATVKLDTNGKADVWLWRAQQSSPSHRATDMMLYPGTIGLLADAGTGGTEPNGESLPIFTRKRASTTDPRILIKADAEPLPADVRDGSGVPEGTYLPRDIINEQTGSRADVSVISSWNSGRWTVVFKRMLDTKNSDDVSFADPRISYPMTIAIMNNVTWDGMLTSDPFALTFGDGR